MPEAIETDIRKCHIDGVLEMRPLGVWISVGVTQPWNLWTHTIPCLVFLLCVKCGHTLTYF